MKRIFVFVLAAVAASSCTFIKVGDEIDELMNIGSGSECQAIQPGDVKEFSSLEIDVPACVTFTQDSACICGVKFEDPSDAPKLKIGSTAEGKLVFSTKKRNEQFKKNVRITLSSAVLEEIEINGACVLDVNGTLSADKLSVESNGAGNIRIEDLDCDELAIEVNGTGNVAAAGRADRTDIEINGIGKVNIRNLKVIELKKEVNGLGAIEQ